MADSRPIHIPTMDSNPFPFMQLIWGLNKWANMSQALRTELNTTKHQQVWVLPVFSRIWQYVPSLWLQIWSKATFKTYLFKNSPGGPGVKNLPSSAEDTGSIAAPGIKTPQAVGVTQPRHHNQSGLHTTITESKNSRALCCRKDPAQPKNGTKKHAPIGLV